MRSLADLSMAEKIMHAGFIFLVGLGLLVAEAYTYVTHARLDGKPGISVQDVAILLWKSQVQQVAGNVTSHDAHGACARQ